MQKVGIKAMPTFKLFQQSVEVEEKVGFPGEAALREMLEKHGAKLSKTE